MDKASLKKQCEQQEWLHQANPFWHLRIEKLQNHPLNTTECEHVFHEHQLGSDFYFVTPACVKFLQLSVPPVTLIYLGARRSGILATEADIPTLFVLSHNVLVCVYVYSVCACACAFLQCGWACVYAHMRTFFCVWASLWKPDVRMQTNTLLL